EGITSEDSDENADALLSETPTLELPKISVPKAAALPQHEEQYVATPLPPTTPVPSITPTFLEQIMIDEFSLATTSSSAVWTGPIKKTEVLDEAQKAVLRRELSGSFLLEECYRATEKMGCQWVSAHFFCS